MDRSSGHRLQAAGLMVFVLNFLLMFPALSQSNDSTVLDQTGKKQRFNFTANGVYAILETNLRFETANGLLGLRLNLEDHLGLEKYKIMPVFSGRFNIKNRHNLFGMFYSLPRSSYFRLQKDIEYNGQIINIDTDIHTYFNINALSLGYMYDVIHDSRSHLGLFINFYILSLRSGISSDQEKLNENFKITASLPNFGAQTYYKIHKRFGLSGIISLFFLSLDDLSGAIHTLGGQMDFYLTRWLELGVGYYMFDLNIEAYESQFTGIIDYTYQGPYLSLGFRF